MCTPCSQASPSVICPNPSVRLARPARSDFTSVPVSPGPASTTSSLAYSCRARRLLAMIFLPSCTATSRLYPASYAQVAPEREERRTAADKQPSDHRDDDHLDQV